MVVWACWPGHHGLVLFPTASSKRQHGADLACGKLPGWGRPGRAAGQELSCKGSTWEQHGWTKCPPVCNRVPGGGRGSNQDSDDLPDLELPLPVRSGVLEGETRRGEPPGEGVGVGGGEGLRVDLPLVPDAKRQVLGSTRAAAGVPNPTAHLCSMPMPRRCTNRRRHSPNMVPEQVRAWCALEREKNSTKAILVAWCPSPSRRRRLTGPERAVDEGRRGGKSQGDNTRHPWTWLTTGHGDVMVPGPSLCPRTRRPPLSPFDSPATLTARYSPHASEKKVRSASLSSRRSTLVTYTVRATCSHSLLERGLHRRGENHGMSM